MDKRRVVEDSTTQMTCSADIIGNLIDGGLEVEDIAKLLANGWKVSLTSCDCGGRFAWMHPRSSGTMGMFGCVCHRTRDALLRITFDEGRRVDKY